MSNVDLGSLVSLAGAALDGHVVRALEAAGAHGLRPRHGYVFQRLQEGPHSITALGAALEVSQQAMSKTVRDLEARGYVELSSDPADARRTLVGLTTAGWSAIDTARTARREIDAALASAASPEDLAATRRVLGQMLAALDIGDRVATRSVPDPCL